ncbi:MAG: hypothetical protein ACRDGE_05935 [Candidatus Limnocylindria bacterium]
MGTVVRVATVAVFAALAFSLTFVIWPQPPDAPVPPARLMPVLIGLGVADALAFGVGVAFLIFGFPVLARIGGTGPLTWASYLGIGWSLVSWWPHVNMHRVNGASFEGLVMIDIIFHLTLIAVAMILAAFFFRVIRSAPPVSPGLSAR